MRLVLALGGIVLILDQATKWIALRRLPPGAPLSVIDGFFSLTLVMNPGLAFGMLGTVPPGWRWVVALLSIGALGVLAAVATRLLPEGGRVAAVAVGMIFGGAAGNLIDRVLAGSVVDFVDVYWRAHHFWAFNVADSAISVGVAIMILDMLGIGSRRASI
jgi:signal peptidase II